MVSLLIEDQPGQTDQARITALLGDKDNQPEDNNPAEKRNGDEDG